MDTKTLEQEITAINEQLNNKMGNPKRMDLMKKRDRLRELGEEQKATQKEKHEKTTAR